MKYACRNHQCPTRKPVEAEKPPTCYTCGRPMPQDFTEDSAFAYWANTVYSPKGDHDDD